MATRLIGAGQTYTTIQAGINAAVAGDLLSIVVAGTYNEQLTLSGHAAGSAGNRITLQNNSGGAVTVTSSSSPVFELAGKGYWGIVGPLFEFKYTGSGSAPKVFNNTHGTSIDALQLTNITATIDGGSGGGFVATIADSDSCTITGCTFQVTSGASSDHDGLDMLFSSNLTFTNNIIQGASTLNMQDGFVLSGSNITITGNTIKNGQSLANHPDGLVLQGDGNRSGGATANVTIAGNTIQDFDQLIYLDAISAAMSGILVYNNLLRQTSGWTVSSKINGLIIDGEGGFKVEVAAYNNTIDVRGTVTRVLRVPVTVGTNTQILKNNLYINPQFTGTYIDVNNNVTLDYNLYDSAGDATVCNWGGSNKSFAQLQAVPQETNGKRTTPGIVGSGNYAASSGASAIVSAALNLTSTFSTDITGATRPSGATPWTIGAYEWNTSGGTAPTVTSVTINAAGTQATVVFSASCTNGAGGGDGWILTASGGAITMTYSSGSGSGTYLYALSGRTIKSGETVTAAYAQPGTGIQSTAGSVNLVTFSGQAVTNNSTQSVAAAVTNVGRPYRWA